MRSELSVPWWSYPYAITVSTLLLLVVAAPSAQGQTVIATVGGGCCISNDDYTMAVNAVTNKVYVHNSDLTYFSVIDGATNSSIQINTPLPLKDLAVNPTTNRIYWTIDVAGTLLVLDGATDSFAAVIDPNTDQLSLGVAVNSVTNKIYVTMYSGSGDKADVTVVDGVTNSVTATIPITNPTPGIFGPLAVDAATNKVYVANGGSLTVIDGATNATTTVTGAGGRALGVNPVTNKIYVANASSLTVIDGATNSTVVVPGAGGGALAVNSVTNKIYVSNGSTVTVIDGTTNSTIPVPGTDVGALAVNSVTNKIYVAERDKVLAIDGATNSTTTVNDPNANAPVVVVVNPVTNRIYVANNSSANVTVIDGRNEPSALLSPLEYICDPNFLCVDLGGQGVGTTSAARNLRLSDGGPMPLSITGIFASGDFAQTNDCPGTVSPGSSCVVSVTFTPTATGPRSGAITITSNSPYSPQTFPLGGTGSIPPKASLAPSSVSFAAQTVGTTSPAQPATLKNIGGQLLNIFSFGTLGDFAQTNDCRTGLDVGASCTFSLTFTPTAPGVRSGSLVITDDAAGSPQKISLTGIGASGGLTLTPTRLTFASQAVGTASAIQKVTLTNHTTVDLESGLYYLFPNNADFEGLGGNCGAHLAAGASCTVGVAFTPTQDGKRYGDVKVLNPLGAPVLAPLSGTGTGSAAIADLEPSNPITFGTHKVGTASAVKTLVLINEGNAPLKISSITSSGDFAETNNCPASLAAGAKCSIPITFKPTATGLRTGSVVITDNSPHSPQISKLSSTGN